MVHAAAQLAPVSAALREHGYVVADMPPSALLERVEAQRPAAVIVDASQPGAVEAIERTHDAPAGVQIDVFVIGLPEAASADPARSIGTAFFEASVSPEAIVGAVDALLRDRAGVASLRVSSDEEELPVSSAGDDALASMIPPIQMVRTSSMPPERTSSQPPGYSSSQPPEASAWSRGPLAGPTTMSPDLERLLREAEQRMLADPGVGSDVPTPEEEVNAILPADVLAALDEPLDSEAQENKGAAAPQSSPTPTGSTGINGGYTTGSRGALATTGIRQETQAGTRAETMAGSRHETMAGSRSEIPAEVRQEAPTGPPEDGRQSTTGSRELTTGSRELTTGSHEVQDEDEADAELTPPPATPRTGVKLPKPPVQEPRAADARDKPTSAPPPTQARPEWDYASSEQTPQRGVRAAVPEESTPTPPPAKVQEIDQRAAAPASPELPEVLSESFDGLRVIAKCIATRASVSLCFEDRSVLRRAILRDGDFVTSASSATDESLVAYLVARGDLSREVGVRLGSRLPPFGRHAAAALIAHGHLGQDQLWPVLRAHAEWLLGRMVTTRSGVCAVEAEPPGRLRAEPSVFGGAAGAEVLVEVSLRVLQPEDAVARLGGARARLADGARKGLLSECALSETDRNLVEEASGRTVGEVLRDAAAPELAPMLVALVDLGVLEVLPSVGQGSQDDESKGTDLLDAEAVRARVKARMAIVQEGDYFEVLGVSKAATTYEIRRAFLEMRRAFEPSQLLTAATADLADDVRTLVEVIEEAWEALRDQTRRERYRAALVARPPA